MRPRNEVAVAVAGLLLLSGVVAWIASRRDGPTDVSVAPSTFATDPGGASALVDALRRLDRAPRRWRARLRTLPDSLTPGDSTLVAVIEPKGLQPDDREALLEVTRRGDLLLAGSGASSLMHCFGYRTRIAGDTARIAGWRDSLRAVVPGRGAVTAVPWVHHRLAPRPGRVWEDSSRRADGRRFRCDVPAIVAVDTLLRTERGEAVALRLHPADRPGRIVLVAESDLFRNGPLRRTDAGEFALGLLAPYRRVIFDEYHHGHGAGGSLPRAVLAWSKGSPWGWFAWQLAAVGMIALLASAIRFGAVRPGVAHRRRSPLEHVHALATALSAARGADEAIGAIVRGLRRRLGGSVGPRGDLGDWLAGMRDRAPTPRQRELFDTLLALTHPGRSVGDVRRAALTVEALWQELHP